VTGQQLERELTQVKVLKGLTYPALRRLVDQGRLIQAHEGQIVIGPGFGSTGVFVVLEGSVAVQMPGGPVISYLGRYDILGEIALMEGVERTAYCRAYTDTLLFEIPFASFHADLAVNDVVRESLEDLTGHRLGMQQDIREGMIPEVEAPDKPEAELETEAAAESTGTVDTPASSASDGPTPAKPSGPPKPPAIYATA
jgi:CRP-like cAMP-binding protein